MDSSRERTQPGLSKRTGWFEQVGEKGGNRRRGVYFFEGASPQNPGDPGKKGLNRAITVPWPRGGENLTAGEVCREE